LFLFIDQTFSAGNKDLEHYIATNVKNQIRDFENQIRYYEKEQNNKREQDEKNQRQQILLSSCILRLKDHLGNTAHVSGKDGDGLFIQQNFENPVNDREQSFLKASKLIVDELSNYDGKLRVFEITWDCSEILLTSISSFLRELAKNKKPFSETKSVTFRLQLS